MASSEEASFCLISFRMLFRFMMFFLPSPGEGIAAEIGLAFISAAGGSGTLMEGTGSFTTGISGCAAGFASFFRGSGASGRGFSFTIGLLASGGGEGLIDFFSTVGNDLNITGRDDSVSFFFETILLSSVAN